MKHFMISRKRSRPLGTFSFLFAGGCPNLVDRLITIFAMSLDFLVLRWRPHKELCFDWSAGLSTGVFLSIRENVRSPSFQSIPTKPTSSPTFSDSAPASVSIPLQLFLGSPSTALFPFEELVLPRHAGCVLSRLRCNGHRIGRIENPSCSACGHSSHVTSHLILHCPATDSLRRSLFGDSLSLYDLWSKPWGVARLLGSMVIREAPIPRKGLNNNSNMSLDDFWM